MSRSNFDSLAGIRGVAATVVLLSHIVQLHLLRFVGLNTPLHQISSITSEYAVVIFFILSGYLITHTLEVNIENNGKLRLDIYVAARIARLYPPFLYAIGVSIAVFLVLDIFGLPGRSGPLRLLGDFYAARDIVHLSIYDMITALFMLQGMLEINGPLWSLYMEAKLYVLFACSLAFFCDRRSILQKVGLAVIIVVVSMAAVRFNPSFARYAGYWLIGALAYYMYQPKHWRNKNRVLICILLIFTAQFWAVVIDGMEYYLAARDNLIAIIIAWLLFQVRVRVPGFVRLANCSYSLYATHFPVLILAQSLLISTGSVSIGAAVGVALLGAIAALGVAIIGGAIEAKKYTVQNGLLKMFERLRRIRMNPS